MYDSNIKKNIYKWRENNKEQYNELQKNYSKSYYEKNREDKNDKVLKRYYLNQEMKKFRNILIDP